MVILTSSKWICYYKNCKEICLSKFWIVNENKPHALWKMKFKYGLNFITVCIIIPHLKNIYI